MKGPNVQRWRATLADFRDPEAFLRLINNFQQQTANAFALLPVRVLRSFDYLSPQQWVEPASTGSWLKPSPSYNSVSYWKDIGGVVHLRGVLSGGTYSTTPIFTLPAGFRPASNNLFTVAQSSIYEGTGIVEVQADGDVIAPAITSVQTGVSTYLSLDGISFQADDSSPLTTAPLILSRLALGKPAAGCRVLSCRDLTAGAAAAIPALAWEPVDQDTVRINQIFGLTAGHKYSLTVEILG